MLQNYGPRLAPYADVLLVAGFEAGGFRLGNCCSLSAHWQSPQGGRYLLTMEATDGEARVQANLAYQPSGPPKQATPLRWLFSWMRLDAPPDLTRLLTQCAALADAQHPPERVCRPRHRPGRAKYLMPLRLEPLPGYQLAGFKEATLNR